mmetsp:Transcript_103909/g.325131  ORF Transcript_103909/g.325131 Transcript_103909/m.325131 type:complete len:266 (-) Transcript_103909:1198-1995(-)
MRAHRRMHFEYFCLANRSGLAPPGPHVAPRLWSLEHPLPPILHRARKVLEPAEDVAILRPRGVEVGDHDCADVLGQAQQESYGLGVEAAALRERHGVLRRARCDDDALGRVPDLLRDSLQLREELMRGDLPRREARYDLHLHILGQAADVAEGCIVQAQLLRPDGADEPEEPAPDVPVLRPVGVEARNDHRRHSLRRGPEERARLLVQAPPLSEVTQRRVDVRDGVRLDHGGAKLRRGRDLLDGLAEGRLPWLVRAVGYGPREAL